MKAVLTAIQDGSFAKEWIAEMDKGSPSLAEARKELAATQVEEVGKRLRALSAKPVGAHGVS
jgi:ketol-acid reductoisomerase